MDRSKASRQGRGPSSRWPFLSWRLLPAAAVAMTAFTALSAAAQAAEPTPDAAAALSAGASLAIASPSPSSGPGILGAGVAVYEDDFDDAASWIDLGKDENGRTAVEDGEGDADIGGRSS